MRERPFQPDLGKAIDKAAASVAESGVFEGWLPAGEYTLGPKTFVLRAGTEPMVLDLRKELADDARCIRVTSEELSQALTMATSAYGQADWAGFGDAAREARHMTPCITDEIPDHVAARFHLVTSIEAFRNRDTDLALAAAVVARAEAPKYELPTATVKSDDAFRRLWEDARKVKSGAVVADKPAEGYLLFDGHRRTWRYDGHPVVFQLVDDDGRVTESAYLLDSASLPAYTPLPDGEHSAYSYEGEGSLRGPLLVGAGATAIVAGTLYGLAATKRSAFKNSSDISELPGLHSQANALGTAGVAAGVVAVGFGVGAILTTPF